MGDRLQGFKPGEREAIMAALRLLTLKEEVEGDGVFTLPAFSIRQEVALDLIQELKEAAGNLRGSE